MGSRFIYVCFGTEPLTSYFKISRSEYLIFHPSTPYDFEHKSKEPKVFLRTQTSIKFKDGIYLAAIVGKESDPNSWNINWLFTIKGTRK